jgi:hypothetical protein
MPSLFSRVTRFARSPQGKALAGKAQQLARDPENRRKIGQMRSRLANRRKAG